MNKFNKLDVTVQSWGPLLSAVTSVLVERPRRARKKPSKFIDHVPPAENKLRGDTVRSLPHFMQSSPCRTLCVPSHCMFNSCLVLIAQCEPLKPSKAVWVLHPDHQNKTIALGQCGPHWRSYKKKCVPNMKGVSWEHGMQQVTIEHVYPGWEQTKVLYPNLQRDGITNIGDAMRGEFAEDATILWQTRYLNYVEVSKVN